jgi:fatty-acid desaturase
MSKSNGYDFSAKNILHYFLLTIAIFIAFYVFDYFDLPRMASNSNELVLVLFIGYFFVITIVDQILHNKLGF